MPNTLSQPNFRFKAAKHTALLLAGCIFALASAGCEHGGWQNDESSVPFTPRAAPVNMSSSSLAGAVSAPAADDPQLSHGGDPLVDSADPLAAGQSLKNSGSSRLADGTDPGAGKTADKTQGWYWVVGDIQSGQVGIAVNGTPIGRYSVHIDKEITAYCHPGLNTLAFTHYPLQGSAQQVCDAHLEILDGHAPKGAPPLMVYDTAAANTLALQSPSSTTSTLPSSQGVIDSDSSQEPDGDGDSAGAQNALSAPIAASSAAPPYTDERTFSGA